MSRRILDSSQLISHWRHCRGGFSGSSTPNIVKNWARELIELHDSSAIVTPVYIEFIAGVQSHSELALARAYLSEFNILDEGRILVQDWEEAKRLAARVPPDRKRRQLGDCLILAIAIRLKYEVRTLDKGLRR